MTALPPAGPAVHAVHTEMRRNRSIFIPDPNSPRVWSDKVIGLLTLYVVVCLSIFVALVGGRSPILILFLVGLWVFLTAVVARRLIFIRRSSLVPPGCCRNCGYDLRATPDQCPECGLAATRSPGKPSQYDVENWPQ